MPQPLLCPVCGGQPEAWAPGPGNRANALCSLCGALERHRFLALVLRALARHVTVARILDCAPHTGVRDVLQWVYPDASYVGMDYLEPHRLINLLGDLTRLPLASDSCDLVVCYHVLEHIPDDRAAMREIARALAPGGIAVLQVPHRPNSPTDEDPTAPREERIRRFGQEDHVRWYGKDFVVRLSDSGLRVRVIHPDEVLDVATLTRHGISPREPVWLARAGGSAPDPMRLLAGIELGIDEVPPREGRRTARELLSRFLA